MLKCDWGSVASFSVPLNLGETPKQKHLRDYGPMGSVFSKIDTYGAVRNRTYWAGRNIIRLPTKKVCTYGQLTKIPILSHFRNNCVL